MTPSKTINVRWVAADTGTSKVLRYQPIPAGKKPPAGPAGFFSSMGPAMAESCGSVTVCQEESSKEGACAPVASDCRNRQPLVNSWTCRVDAPAVTAQKQTAANKKQRMVRRRIAAPEKMDVSQSLDEP